MTTKSNYITRIWANAGTKVDPTANKYSVGWVVEIPPHEYANFVLNNITQSQAHNNEEGINKWDGATQYPLAALAKDSDGFIYKANAANINHQPSVSNNWDRWGESKDAVTVGTSMVFYQALAPLGWKKDTTKDNHMLRVVSTAGGGSGGTDSPILNNKVAVHTHEATTSVAPNHSHQENLWTNSNYTAEGYPIAGTYIDGQARKSTLGAGAHDHDVTIESNAGSNWTPKYADMIICVYEGT